MNTENVKGFLLKKTTVEGQPFYVNLFLLYKDDNPGGCGIPIQIEYEQTLGVMRHITFGFSQVCLMKFLGENSDMITLCSRNAGRCF